MEERKFIRLKKEEYGIKETIKKNLGKGKISSLDIEYTPVGEKIIVSTSKPGLVIGKKGEKIDELTNMLKQRFNLENPHIEIKEIEKPLLDSQIVADDIAGGLERAGNIRFKVIAYRKLREVMNAGALGCEIKLSGKLPSERARAWRFAEGYLKKAGESSKNIDRAETTALTKTGIVGVKVAIMKPGTKVYDKIEIDEINKGLSGGDEEGKEEEDESEENKGEKKGIEKKSGEGKKSKKKGKVNKKSTKGEKNGNTKK